MTRTAFIHIGTHKTGTTYLQNWMRLNNEHLNGIGLDYPSVGLSEQNAAHFVLSLETRKSKGELRGARHWGELEGKIQNSTHDIILSAETFSDRIETASIAQKIVEFFDGVGMKTVFIVFLRDVPAYFNSRYVQGVKNLRVERTLPDYIEARRGERVFDYVRLLRPFEEVADVIALPYQPYGTPIERQFMQAVGREDDLFDQIPWHPIERKNKSFGPRSVQVALEIARSLPTGVTKQQLNTKRQIFKRLATQAGFNDVGFVGIDTHTAEALRRDFSDKTEIIAQRYFGRPWSDVVPPEDMFEKFADQQGQEGATLSLERKIVRRVLKQDKIPLRELFYVWRLKVRKVLQSVRACSPF